MPRLVRKVVVYVCTLDGSIHRTSTEARAAAKALSDKARAKSERAKKKASKGKARGSQTDAILRAILNGHQSAVDIRRATKVRPQNIHPLLNGLRRRKLVNGRSGSYALTAAGKKRVAAAQA